MTNLEVARELVRKALVYGKSGDLSTFAVVVANLEEIFNLLDEPARDNDEYDWNDFNGRADLLHRSLPK